MRNSASAPAFISERWNVKEASSLVGAACAVTSRMQIATAATNHNTRHPLITGSWATTMHRLSGGRFTLGIGRGVAAMYGAFGVPPVTTAQMEDFAQVMRRLWHGEVVFNHDGPIGKYQLLFLDPDFNEDIRLAIVAFGPKTLALGGREFDDVILHTYFTPETLQRAVKTVKDAAEQAGRDPDDVRVWSCFATVGDHLPEELRLKKTVARLATYLQGYGELLVNTNGWDPSVLQRFRDDKVVQSIAGGIDHKATAEQIEHIATLIPDEWLEPSATGSAQQCVDRIRKEFDYGADALIMHGATPDELEPIVDGVPRHRRLTRCRASATGDGPRCMDRAPVIQPYRKTNGSLGKGAMTVWNRNTQERWSSIPSRLTQDPHGLSGLRRRRRSTTARSTLRAEPSCRCRRGLRDRDVLVCVRGRFGMVRKGEKAAKMIISTTRRTPGSHLVNKVFTPRATAEGALRPSSIPGLRGQCESMGGIGVLSRDVIPDARHSAEYRNSPIVDRRVTPPGAGPDRHVRRRNECDGADVGDVLRTHSGAAG